MERPEKGGLTRRRKTAGLNFAPVHQLFQQQNDFLALPAWPVCSPGDVRRGAQEAAPSKGGGGSEARVADDCLWDLEHVPRCLVLQWLHL